MKTTLYPIPADDVLWVAVQDAMARSIKLTVFDASGSSCHSCELQPGTEYPAPITVSALPTGAYYLQMEQGDENCMKSFMVVR